MLLKRYLLMSKDNNLLLNVKETLDYEKFKPISDGLFCEKIFGPINNFECSCKRHKKSSKKMRVTRNLNICPKCKVELTNSSIRNYRLG